MVLHDDGDAPRDHAPKLMSIGEGATPGGSGLTSAFSLSSCVRRWKVPRVVGAGATNDRRTSGLTLAAVAVVYLDSASWSHLLLPELRVSWLRPPGVPMKLPDVSDE